MPPGVERIGEYIHRVKSIDPGRSSPEVKQALKEYTESMEQSFNALKKHEDITNLDKICVQKGKSLADAVQKNQ